MSSLAHRLLELLQIPSTTGCERELRDHISQQVERWGGVPLAIRNSLVVLGPVRTERPTVGLFGHLDTVDSYRGALRVEGDRIHGCGASDMKGGLASMLTLMEALDDDRAGWNLVFVFYAGEEGPADGNDLQFVLDTIPEVSAVDLGIFLEPTDNKLQLGCVGSLHARVAFEGLAAHSARPWQGVNAIHKASQFLQQLAIRKPRAAASRGLVFYEVMSATTARGGSQPNVIPAHMEFNVNCRFAPGRHAVEVEEDLRRLAGPDATVTVWEVGLPAPVPLDNALVQQMATTTQAPIEAKQAWTDVATLAQRGVAALNFGPGLQSQCHRVDEYASISQLQRFYELLLRCVYGA